MLAYLAVVVMIDCKNNGCWSPLPYIVHSFNMHTITCQQSILVLEINPINLMQMNTFGVGNAPIHENRGFEMTTNFVLLGSIFDSDKAYIGTPSDGCVPEKVSTVPYCLYRPNKCM